MLGPIKSGWGWAAYGKHPSAGDYIRIGRESPLTKSFADWVERGYTALDAKKNAAQNPVAWRFWARGAGKENIVCGIVKDSSDKVGRHFPLLIIGSGNLKDWENRWDLLPLAFDKPWGQIEYASARMADDLNTLGNEIQNIRSPNPEWPGLEASRKGLIESMTAPGNEDFNNLKTRASGLSDKPEGYISLDHKSSHDQFALISCWHLLLKTHNKNVPNAVFLGGTFEHSYMAFFNRSLQTADFVRLWDVTNSALNS